MKITIEVDVPNWSDKNLVVDYINDAIYSHFEAIKAKYNKSDNFFWTKDMKVSEVK